MLELYRETGDSEYLDRALLWYQWFRKHGMDQGKIIIKNISMGSCSQNRSVLLGFDDNSL